VTGGRELNNFDLGDGDLFWSLNRRKNVKNFGPASAGLPYMGIIS
jgi:hypothetical protein